VEGLTYGEAIAVVAETVRRNELVGFDLVELAPNLDPGGLSALVGARFLAEVLACWAG
jgi:agmatinase